MITRQFRGASDRVHTDRAHGVAILRRFLHRYDLAVHLDDRRGGFLPDWTE